MGILTGLGLGAITGAAGNLIGSIGSGKRYKKQTKIQEESQKRLNEQAAELNYNYGEQAAENALERGFKSADYNQGIWEKQFELQNEKEAMQYQTAISDIEKAGLSYGVLSGGGLAGGGGVGGGGGTPSAGTGAGNQKAARAADAAQQEANRIAKQQAQIEALRSGSEIELANSEAKKIDAETELINKQAGAFEETNNAETQLILAETENTKVRTEGEKFANTIMKIQSEISIESKEMQLDRLETEWRILDEQLREATRNNDIGEETKDAIVQAAYDSLKNMAIERIVGSTKANLNNRQIKEIGQLIDLKINEGELNILKLEHEIQKTGINVKLEEAKQTAGFINKILSLMGAIGAAKLVKPSKGSKTKK